MYYVDASLTGTGKETRILTGYEVLACGDPPTTTTTTVTTTTRTVPPTPCGSYRVYDPTVDITEITTYGVIGGTFTDGDPWYVGYGDNSGCISQNVVPVLLSANPKTPGGYSTCGGAAYKVTGTYYVIDHPNLVWVSTNNTDMMTLTNALKITGVKYSFFFGRVVDGNVTYPGKVHNGNGYVGLLRFIKFKGMDTSSTCTTPYIL